MKLALTTAIALLVGIMLFAPQLGAEQTAEIRFRATVQALVPLAGFSGEITQAAVDPRFALTMRIETTVPEAPELAAGGVVTFAIHSPSLLFGEEPKRGETYDFILYGKVQDGKVRFFGLQRGYPAIMDRDYQHWVKAQKYAAIGFEPIDCFAGLVKVRKKRLLRQSFSVYLPNRDMKCCGTIVRSALTDDHGRFLVEPLKSGEYFAKFEVNGVGYLAPFAVIKDYDKCSTENLELDFFDVNSFKFQQSILLDD